MAEGYSNAGAPPSESVNIIPYPSFHSKFARPNASRHLLKYFELCALTFGAISAKLHLFPLMGIMPLNGKCGKETANKVGSRVPRDR